MRKLFTALIVSFFAALTGCSSLPSASQLGEMVASSHRDAVGMRDGDMAQYIRKNPGVMSLRTSTLQEKPKTMMALLDACKAGRSVEVIVYAGDISGARQLRGTCIQGFVSDNPDLNRGEDVLLVDSQRLVMGGNDTRATPAQVRQDYAYRATVKQHATRVN